MTACSDNQAASPSKTGGFKDVLNQWKAADQSVNSTPFMAMVPKRQKSVIAAKNQAAINDYRKKFTRRGHSNRGLKGGGKPTQLKDVFGVKLELLEDYVPCVFDKTQAEVDLIKKGLEKNFFFEDMTPAELDTFIKAFEPFYISRGMAIIYQGEAGDYFYVISEGIVSFEMNGEIVGMAGAGKSFGELALLYACPRAATVYAASEKTSFFRVDQRTFRSVLQNQTKKSEALKLKLLRSVDFLKELDESDMKRLGDALSPRMFKEEDVLVKKGEEGDAFYILQEGEMNVTDISVGNSKFDDIILKPGDYFGERALATDEPRAANVTALTEGVAFYIDRSTFEKVLGKFARLVIKAQDRRLLVRKTRDGQDMELALLLLFLILGVISLLFRRREWIFSKRRTWNVTKLKTWQILSTM
jgi:cAMP-dependent protein kinase regulator